MPPLLTASALNSMLSSPKVKATVTALGPEHCARIICSQECHSSWTKLAVCIWVNEWMKFSKPCAESLFHIMLLLTRISSTPAITRLKLICTQSLSCIIRLPVLILFAPTILKLKLIWLGTTLILILSILHDCWFYLVYLTNVEQIQAAGYV